MEESRKSKLGKFLATRFWRHKYFWTIGVFLILVGFVDPNSLLHRFNQQQHIRDLKNAIEEKQQKSAEDVRRLNELDRNPQAIEKIAREMYYMKKTDEDVYVIEKNGEETNESDDVASSEK